MPKLFSTCSTVPSIASLSAPALGGWACIDHDIGRIPTWLLKLEVTGRDLKPEKAKVRELTLLPGFAHLTATAPTGPPPQCQLSALVTAGELRASHYCYSLVLHHPLFVP